MKWILFPVVVIFVVACSTVKNSPSIITENETVEVPPQKPQRNAMVESSIGKFEESDPLDIDSLYVEGNKLFMHVHYGGGCKEHQFKMIGSPVVMKTLPAKRSVQLVHDNEDDQCKSIVYRILEIDLKNLAIDQTPGSTIVLLLQGWEEGITYTFE